MSEPALNPFVTGLACRCPRCGKGALFEGFLTVRKQCPVCGFDLQAADSGDGPVFFVALLGGTIVAAGAFITEMMFEPPVWLQFIIWVPLTILICMGMMRPFKSLLISLQFRFKGGQSQFRGP